MPRRDRKRYDEGIAQWVAFANLLGPGDPARSQREPGFLDELERRFAETFPASDADLEAAIRDGDFIVAASAVETASGVRWVARGGTTQALSLALGLPVEPLGHPPRAGVLRLADGRPFLIADRAALHDLARSVAMTLRGVVTAIEHTPFGFASAPLIEASLVVERGRPVHVVRPHCIDAFLDALQQTHADRIRRCPVCLLLFLARRNNTGGCSPRCRTTLRVRRVRGTVERHRKEAEARLAMPEQIDTTAIIRRREQRRARSRRG